MSAARPFRWRTAHSAQHGGWSSEPSPAIPCTGTDARVVDPATLKEVPPGEAGAISFRGASVFSGHWKRPDATASAFIEFNGGKCFRSGDLGRVEEGGCFFITDRLKRMRKEHRAGHRRQLPREHGRLPGAAGVRSVGALPKSGGGRFLWRLLQEQEPAVWPAGWACADPRRIPPGTMGA